MSRKLLYVLALFTCLAGLAANAEEWNKTYSVSGKTRLHAVTDDGSVTVRAWDDRRIEARVVTRGIAIGNGGVTIRESQTGDSVDLEVRMPKNRGFHWGNKSVQVELRVPRDTQLDVRSGDGAIKASGLHSEVRLLTGDGGIDVDAMDGSVEARSGDGHIQLQGRFDAVNVHTGDGSIDIRAGAGSKLASGWRIESGDGSVTLRVPQSLAADLDLKTGDGGISVDFPYQASTGTQSRSQVRGRLNGGGGLLVIRTGDGAIRLGAS